MLTDILFFILWLILALIVILIILLFVPVSLSIKKNQNEKTEIKAELLSFDLMKLFKKLSKSEKKKKKKPEAKEKKKDDRSFKEKVIFYCNLTSKALSEINFILSHIRVSSLNLKLICAESNAAFTAITYGAVSAAVYPVLGIIEHKTKVDEGAFTLNIGADYNSNKSEYAFSITLHLSLIFAVIGGIRFFISYKKLSDK